MTHFPYRFAWRNNTRRASLYGRPCRICVRGTMNSALVQFEDGHHEVVSRNALRRIAEEASEAVKDEGEDAE